MSAPKLTRRQRLALAASLVSGLAWAAASAYFAWCRRDADLWLICCALAVYSLAWSVRILPARLDGVLTWRFWRYGDAEDLNRQ